MIHTPNSLTKSLQDNNLSFVPSISIRIERFADIPLRHFALYYGDNLYNMVRQELKTNCNYTLDNSILRVANGFGHEFALIIRLVNITRSSKKQWEIAIWDYTGNASLGEWRKEYNDDNDCLSFEEIDSIHTKLKEFSNGIQYCSDCQCKMPSGNTKYSPKRHEREYGGRYFAGHYCSKCWNDKWKEIESKETYE